MLGRVVEDHPHSPTDASHERGDDREDPVREADQKIAAARLQCAQAAWKSGLRHNVTDDVLDGPVAREVLFRVVDHRIGAERRHEVGILWTAHRRDMRTVLPGELHRERPEAKQADKQTLQFGDRDVLYSSDALRLNVNAVVLNRDDGVPPVLAVSNRLVLSSFRCPDCSIQLTGSSHERAHEPTQDERNVKVCIMSTTVVCSCLPLGKSGTQTRDLLQAHKLGPSLRSLHKPMTLAIPEIVRNERRVLLPRRFQYFEVECSKRIPNGLSEP